MKTIYYLNSFNKNNLKYNGRLFYKNSIIRSFFAFKRKQIKYKSTFLLNEKHKLEAYLIKELGNDKSFEESILFKDINKEYSNQYLEYKKSSKGINNPNTILNEELSEEEYHEISNREGIRFKRPPTTDNEIKEVLEDVEIRYK